MSSEISYTCPHCSGEMTYAPEHRGMDSQCPHCQKPIVLGLIVLKKKVCETLQSGNLEPENKLFDLNARISPLWFFLILIVLFGFSFYCWNRVIKDENMSDWIDGAFVTTFGALMLTTLLTVRLFPKLLNLARKSNPNVAIIIDGVASFAKTVFLIAFLIASICSVCVVVVGAFGLLFDSLKSHSTPSYTTEANYGYMTRQEDDLLTAAALKKGYGASLTKEEQDILDKAEAGKLEKPYGNRPDKQHDSPAP